MVVVKYLVTGGAGFIGSHVVDRLMAKEDNYVTVYDNLSTGKKEFIDQHFGKRNFEFVKADLLDLRHLKNVMENQDFVFHLAANPDIRKAQSNTRIELEQGIIATYNVLEAMRSCNVKKIAFTSSSTVYGESGVIPTPEDYGPLLPISLYGASKLAAEGLLTSFAYTFDMEAWIFRLANIVGSRQTHGILVDFIKKLRTNPRVLEILGDGKQEKSYLLVNECVDAMFYVLENAKGGDRVNVYNIGPNDQISVRRITQILVEELGLKNVKFRYTGGERGWKGDVPRMMPSAKKINDLGWKARHSSEEAIRFATRLLVGGIR